MNSEDLTRVEEIFQRAADLPPEERAGFLEDVCPDEPDLRARVAAMLSRMDRDESLAPGGFPGTAEVDEGPGTVIGRYRLLQKIGEGGYGIVYMAQQLEPVERRVALKVIKLGMDTREVVARFEAERQALAMMDHPGIARVLDGGATGSGRPYFVMELVRGVSIHTYCDDNGLVTRERLQLFRDVCLAVHHAHQKGVIHRDIKPSNVMVSLHDGRPVVKVIDFGIAKAMHTRLTEKTLFTEYNRFIGTPAYMSPEQAEMSAVDIDTRTDIYSLGVLLYELLTGSTPFDTRSLFRSGLAEIQRVIREVEPQRPSLRVSTSAEATSRVGVEGRVERARHLRGDLDWIVMKALEKDRTRRYASASELSEDARRHLENEPVLAGPPHTLYRVRKFLARNRAAAAWVTVILLALVSGIVGTTAGLIEAQEQRDEAERAVESAHTVTGFLVRTLALADPEIALAPELSITALLHRAAMRVTAELGEQPRAEARVRVAIGRAYESLGQPELAHAHLGRAISLIEGMPDYDRAEFYVALWRLTHVLFVLERPEALAVAQHARRVAHDLVRVSHPELADAFDRFVRAADEAAHEPGPERTAALEPLFRATVALSEATLAGGDPLWLILSDSYQHAGYDLWFSPVERASVPFWERSLEIQRRELGPGHPQLAQTLAQLTGVLNRLGRLSDAEERIRESIDVVHRAYPDGSFKVALSHGALGENLTLQGRFEEAEQHLLSSHRTILETTDAVTFFPADSYRRLIGLYAGWGREEQAGEYRAEFAQLASRAANLQPFDIARCCFGPQEAALVERLEELRGLCGDISFPVEPGERSAERLDAAVGELLQVRRATCADGDPLAIVVGRYLLHWSNQIDAEVEEVARAAMVEEALRVVPAIVESAPLEVAEVYAQSADVARRAAGGAAARDLAGRCLTALAGSTGADAWFGAAAKVRIARCLLRLGMFADAEDLILPGYVVFLEQLGSEHSKAAAVRALAADLYAAWGRPDQIERAYELAAPR